MDRVLSTEMDDECSRVQSKIALILLYSHHEVMIRNGKLRVNPFPNNQF